VLVQDRAAAGPAGDPAAFDSRILALGGSAAQLEAARRSFGLRDGCGAAQEPVAFLLDQAGRYVAHFAPDVPADEVARRVRKRLGGAS
jgi:hypothetical protein